MTVSPETIRAGLIARGAPPHVADAFILNFQDESGLNPGINEIAPLVPGSRGGFGLAQWTGPRRVALERFAASRGVPPSDLDAQLDYLMTELQGPEARAAASIFAAPDVSSAAVAIARDFLRPAPENLDRRVSRYSGGAPAPRDRQSPAASPAAPAPSVAALVMAYRSGRMTPEDAALFEKGMQEGLFPRVAPRAAAPDPLADYEQIAMRPRAPMQTAQLTANAANPFDLSRFRGL
jgi:hypothetical protein